MSYGERPSSVPGLIRWRRTGSGERIRVLPDGCTDLILVGEKLLVAGPDTTAAVVDSTAECYIGVRLPPGLADRVFGVAALELRDQRLELDQVWPGGRARGLRAAVLAGPAPLAVLEQAVGDLLTARPRWTGFVLQAVRSGRPVSRIAAELGWSARRLHRESLRSFGYGPAMLGRILRFQRAVDLARTGLGLSAVAAEAGYADQPHLAREARSLAGVTMTQLLTEPVAEIQ